MIKSMDIRRENTVYNRNCVLDLEKHFSQEEIDDLLNGEEIPYILNVDGSVSEWISISDEED